MIAIAIMEQAMIGIISHPPALTSSSTAEIPLFHLKGRIILDFQRFKKGFLIRVGTL
jgi:hypothetical protein